MAKVQKTYTREFKEEAVRLVKNSGKPITQIARELGISESTLSSWWRQHCDKGEHAFPGSGRHRSVPHTPAPAPIRSVAPETLREYTPDPTPSPYSLDDHDTLLALQRDLDHVRYERDLLKEALCILARGLQRASCRPDSSTLPLMEEENRVRHERDLLQQVLCILARDR